MVVEGPVEGVEGYYVAGEEGYCDAEVEKVGDTDVEVLGNEYRVVYSITLRVTEKDSSCLMPPLVIALESEGKRREVELEPVRLLVVSRAVAEVATEDLAALIFPALAATVILAFLLRKPIKRTLLLSKFRRLLKEYARLYRLRMRGEVSDAMFKKRSEELYSEIARAKEELRELGVDVDGLEKKLLERYGLRGVVRLRKF